MTAVATDPREDFVGWVMENYETDLTTSPIALVCKRCGAPAFHVTKHAVDAHGDAIEVGPSVASPASVKRWTDTFGPDTAHGVFPRRGA